MGEIERQMSEVQGLSIKDRPKLARKVVHVEH
jgi:hypothetical protein